MEKRNVCIYFNKRNMCLFGLNRNILLDKHIWKNTFHFFRKCNYNIQNANWSKERGICIDYLYTFCKQESILVCKLVTVSCLSQYSGCKCILTLTNETISLGQAYSYTFLLVWFNGDRQTDRQTYCIRDINDHLNVSFHWFHIFATILKSWDDVKPSNLFILVFVVVLLMSPVILCENVTPTMHCMDHHVSYSLWADAKERKNISL